jgi:His/Glu/Gln/Arg/opine family amino acid ABC transporter permease subunit
VTVVESLQATLELLLRLLPRLSDGVWVTLEVALLSFGWAVLGALILLPLRLSSRPGVSLAVRAYVEAVRNTPLLLQIYVLYFGLPLLSLPLSAMATGVLAIGLQHGAYLVEIFRGAVGSISREQRDAAKALGLRPFAAFWLVIFPQALIRVLAPLTNQSIVLVKDTTLVSAISVMDLTLIGKLIVERSAASDAFIVIAIFYLGLTSVLGLVHRLIERRYARRV